MSPRPILRQFLVLALLLSGIASPASADYNKFSIVYRSDSIPGTVCWEIEILLVDSDWAPDGYLYLTDTGAQSASVEKLLDYASVNNAYRTYDDEPEAVSEPEGSLISHKLSALHYARPYDLSPRNQEDPDSGAPIYSLVLFPDSPSRGGAVSQISLENDVAIIDPLESCAPGFGQATVDSHGTTPDDESNLSPGHIYNSQEGTFTGGAVSATGKASENCHKVDDGPWSCTTAYSGTIVLYGAITVPVTEFSASVDVQPSCDFSSQPVSVDENADVAIDAYGLDARVIRAHAWFSGTGPGQCAASNQVLSF